MKHFSPSEFIDFTDGVLEPSRAAHADGCAACRAQAALVQDVMRTTSSAEIPEPSPLFWDHFSARVRDGVAAEPRTAGWALAGMRGWASMAAAVAIVLAFVSAAWVMRDARNAPSPSPVAQDRPAAAPGISGDVDIDTPLAEGNAEVWAVLTAAASDMALDEARAAGMKPHPAAVDRAVQGMTTAELNELGRLLQSELKRSSN
jgi:hypothetical protein